MTNLPETETIGWSALPARKREAEPGIAQCINQLANYTENDAAAGNTHDSQMKAGCFSLK
ncbi:hypothetical protein TUM12370_34750 [Salmonella enterica subsp. enterica serovar Choleraesuis]|nr:hypothetical protein TUM12370_34750 [Salmonella enterica subsp. enterica serovar Choleraesuis]